MIDDRKQSEKYLTFSQRYGYEPIPQSMHLEEISDSLRQAIWNEARRLLLLMRSRTSSERKIILNKVRRLFTRSHISSDTYYFEDEAARVIERVIGEIKKQTEDNVNIEYNCVLTTFKDIILNSPFSNVLDFIELILSETPKLRIQEDRFLIEINHAFKKHNAAYWLDTSKLPPRFFPQSTKMQGEAAKLAIATIRSEEMIGADTHLREAADHINAGQFADSIADSIHAVESVARTINPKAKQLGPALDSLQKSGLLKHHALKEAFSKLYGYTSDEQGIRHSLLDKPSPDVDLDEAMFMFGACASFAAYLVNKHRKAEQLQGRDQ